MLTTVRYAGHTEPPGHVERQRLESAACVHLRLASRTDYAFGSLLSGLTVELAKGANGIIFVTLTGFKILGGVDVALSPETVTRKEGALELMSPRFSLPVAAHGGSMAAAPVGASAWMLAGLSGGLAPSLMSGLFHIKNHLVSGLAGFTAPTVSVLAGLALAKSEPGE